MINRSLSSSKEGVSNRLLRWIIKDKIIFLLILFLFYSYFIYYLANNGSCTDIGLSGDLDDYDLGCNGYSLNYRVKDQQRILASVREELLRLSEKLEDVHKTFDELNKQIPLKQLELSSIEGDIENAQRALQELRERRNVQVFLPHAPLGSKSNTEDKIEIASNPKNFEDVIDFSRCSISRFLPIYIYPTSDTFNSWIEHFKTEGTIVNTKDEACISIYLIESDKTELTEDTRNLVVIHFGLDSEPLNRNYIQVQANNIRRNIDISLYLNVSEFDESGWKQLPALLPYMRKNFILYFIDEDGEDVRTSTDINTLSNSAKKSQDAIEVVQCSQPTNSICYSADELSKVFKASMFCILSSNLRFQSRLYETLKSGCIPVILNSSVILPFENEIDWRLATIRIPRARFPEVHFVLRSYSMADTLEMRRQGRIIFENYLGDRKAIVRSLIVALRYRLMLPSEIRNTEKIKSIPLFDRSFTSPHSTIPAAPLYEEEYLGPLESPFDSPSFQHNFSSLSIYSHQMWNNWPVAALGASPEFLPIAYEPPTEVEFHPDSMEGYRPIEPGSGVEFSRALGGNLQREQFTVVLLTYNRDAVLAAALERLHKMPYLNKIIVIWNNVNRDPPLSWPKLHVPVEFLKMTTNSLNNRFIPWDRIKTEAIFSLDDDIDLRQHEIILAFRIWRENRDRIVGFPARYHARFNDEMFYNSNHTCQLSMILTGAAFIHKAYLHAYTFAMPPAIRKHVDEVTNCEDIAMNFLVSHLTRKPPLKTTSRWTLRCPNCVETLSQDESHFSERHDCIRYFTKVYGYNPLKFSQFRADSILFKTRLPADKQKCFRYV